MSIPSTLVDLSVVADDNTLVNSSRVNTVDDYVRALAAIIKRQGTIHECTFTGSTLNIGSHGSTHIANPTTNISGMTGSFSDGVTDIVFTNTTPITISSGDTLVTDTMTVLKGDTITVKKSSTGVFTVIGVNVYPKARFEAIEAKNTAQDNTLTNHTNSINALNSEVSKRNQIVWGYVDGNGYYANNYVSNMNNALLHTAINLPHGVWEVTAYGVAAVLGDGVRGSVPIGLVRSDGAGISTPPVFQRFDSNSGGGYIPVHFKGIVDNNTGADQNYRLRFGTWDIQDNGTIGGLFGSTLGEQKMYAIRLY